MNILNRDENVGLIGNTVLLMLLAFVFSLAIRMIWVYQMGGVDGFYWGDQLMINTNDGYFFGSGAQRELFGILAHNPRTPDWLAHGIVFITVLLVKTTPFSLDTVMLYLPAFVSSLVVIPIILIGRLYGSSLFGFFAALIGAIAWSYYNRTMVGYYDTDMFSAMMPMFILYFLLSTLETEKHIYMLLSALTIMIYPFMYDSGLSLIYAMGLLYIGYMFVFHRKENFTYESTVLIAIALMGIPIWIKLGLTVGLYLFFARKQLERKSLYLLAAAAVLIFLYTGNVFTLVWAKFSIYFFRGVDESGGLKFYEVAQTVREAGKIPFETMANRISGSIPGILAALLGYIVLVIRHRGFILALPLIGIGVFSLWGGLRFTVYAVPVAAISAVYLFYFVADFMKNGALRYVVIAGLTGAMLYPNIVHIIGYTVPTVFNKQEVSSLEKLSKLGSDKDYIISWWDYGYPLWFYANKNTLIDGSKHHHDNFIVSEILTTTSQIEAASLARIAVETYVSSGYKTVADTLFKNHQPDQLDVSLYLDELTAGSVKLPEATRNIYLYLPLRMLDILPTVKVFSNLDLVAGKSGQRPFFYKTSQMIKQGDVIDFGRGVRFDQKMNELIIGNRKAPVNSIWTTQYDAQGKLHINTQAVNASSSLYMIFMQNYNQLLILDAVMFYSTYIQMSILERFDPALFEPVSLTPMSKIYKLKI